MNVSPRVTVILIVHNGASTLRLALSSLLLQSFQNWECIIVDDASTDGTPEILSCLTDSRFHHLRLPSHQGRGAARQKALSSARAPFICTLDADDFFYPTKLKRQVDILETDPTLAATVGRIFYFAENLTPMGTAIGYYPSGRRKIPNRPSHLRLPFGPTMFRRSENLGVNYSPLPRSEDRLFFMDLLQGKEINMEEEPSYGCFWRMDPDSIQLGLQQNLEIYRTARTQVFSWGTLLVAFTQLKRELYKWVESSGMWGHMTRLKYRKGSREESEDFQTTARAVRQKSISEFGPSPACRIGPLPPPA